jgi:2-keto-4-pentenoate hydratase/2-oxohepta-3-ene-1,7-dioic acid hydratase in catechol pathway
MKILCIGRNYAEHAKELANEVSCEPVLFLKPKSALLAPEKPLYYPEFTDDLHYECELVLRIGRNGRYVSETEALEYVSDISLGIDFTARDLQAKLKAKGLPWEISKAFDGSAAVGRFITKQENTDLDNLHFELRLNNEVVQRGNTGLMIFSPAKVIAYASQFFTLNIGDLIYTGTPVGVGPVNPGDCLEGFLQGEKLLHVEIR